MAAPPIEPERSITKINSALCSFCSNLGRMLSIKAEFPSADFCKFKKQSTVMKLTNFSQVINTKNQPPGSKSLRGGDQLWCREPDLDPSKWLFRSESLSSSSPMKRKNEVLQVVGKRGIKWITRSLDVEILWVGERMSWISVVIETIASNFNS